MNIDNNKACAVIGDTNTGKSNLAVYLASKCSHKKKYTLGYPEKLDGFVNLSSIDDIALIEDCVLFIDELSRYFPVHDRKANDKLMDLLQFAEHNKIKLILTTQLSQFITKQCEAMIPQWAIKQLNVRRLKNGSTPSFVIKHVMKDRRITRDFIKLRVEEFIWYNEQATAGENKIETFICMGVKKDWAMKNTDKNNDKNVTENSDKINLEEY